MEKKRKIPCVVFRKDVKHADLFWPAKSIGVIPFYKDDLSLARLALDKVIELQPIDYYFPDYKEGDEAKRLFTHIGNGIGDIFAFSSMAWYLRDIPLQVHVTKRFHPVFDWFRREDLTLHDYYQPIGLNYNFASRLTKYKGLHRIAIENAAVEYHTGNWFEAHYRRIGINETPEGYGRPMLKNYRISDDPTRLWENSVIISHRSSCQMRSSSLEDFYLPTRKAYPDHNIYVHEIDLTDSDKAYAETADINVIPKCSISQFLLNLYDADMVVSTDSSAIHFREGTERPAVGVFGAMLQSSRTSGYKFTHSFNVKTGCPFQPCVIHEKKQGEVCINAEPGDRVARCQSGKIFQDQLFNELKIAKDEFHRQNQVGC